MTQEVKEPASMSMGGTASTADGRWVQLYESLQPGLLRWLRCLLRDADEAEDCCQETFMRLLREVRSGREPDAPMAWVRRVAHNLVISGARHAAVSSRVVGRLGTPQVADPVVSEIVGREHLAQVQDALARLRPQDRELIILAARGANAEEVGATFRIAPGAARTRLHRARRSLEQAAGLEPGSYRRGRETLGPRRMPRTARIHP